MATGPSQSIHALAAPKVWFLLPLAVDTVQGGQTFIEVGRAGFGKTQQIKVRETSDLGRRVSICVYRYTMNFAVCCFSLSFCSLLFLSLLYLSTYCLSLPCLCAFFLRLSSPYAFWPNVLWLHPHASVATNVTTSPIPSEFATVGLQLFVVTVRGVQMTGPFF